MGGEVILIVDNDRSAIRLAKLHLSNSDYTVEVAQDDCEAFNKIAELKPDLIILEPFLSEANPSAPPHKSRWTPNWPKTLPQSKRGDAKVTWQSGTENAFDIIDRIRQTSDVPIIIVTSTSDETVHITSLERGADDYIIKPFNPRALVARVRAVLRRTLAPPRSLRLIQVGDLCLDTLKREASIDGQPIKLRAKEYAVLEVLAGRQGDVVPREDIIKSVWGEDYFGDDRTLNVHVTWLRSKLAGSNIQLEAWRGVGYKLEVGSDNTLRWTTQKSGGQHQS